MIKVYIPRDSAALAVGADEVAAAISDQAIQGGHDVQIIRNSSRGMFWLETLVEVATDEAFAIKLEVRSAKGSVCFGSESSKVNQERLRKLITQRRQG